MGSKWAPLHGCRQARPQAPRGCPAISQSRELLPALYQRMLRHRGPLTRRNKASTSHLCGGPSQQDAFNHLKTVFTTALVLAHFDLAARLLSKQMVPVMFPLASCPSTLSKEFCTWSLTSRRNTHLRSVTTRSTTRSSWLSFGVSESSVPTSLCRFK